ncbi:hypothetical protein K466DRAFT_590702 [Polyporus arcularius HHB13444]|uniref:Uncharacterized protein n=1 Tax=Polyporus arcularius HHB13444 TaxID=1314778 RepID=A0A5C3P0T5_9APHY|nr:hypothetical protein K466DRAFT_590702 [Polyporus arcularius HHB13444]
MNVRRDAQLGSSCGSGSAASCRMSMATTDVRRPDDSTQVNRPGGVLEEVGDLHCVASLLVALSQCSFHAELPSAPSEVRFSP